MTEEIIIDVNNCPHKSDDDCMEVPICNEYGDLIGYQSCEAQTLCPYRSQKKIERLEQENEMLTRENENRNDWIISLNKKCEELIKEKLNYRSALEEIRELTVIGVNASQCNCGLRALTDDILNKINEVLNEK